MKSSNIFNSAPLPLPRVKEDKPLSKSVADFDVIDEDRVESMNNEEHLFDLLNTTRSGFVDKLSSLANQKQARKFLAVEIWEAVCSFFDEEKRKQPRLPVQDFKLKEASEKYKKAYDKIVQKVKELTKQLPKESKLAQGHVSQDYVPVKACDLTQEKIVRQWLYTNQLLKDYKSAYQTLNKLINEFESLEASAFRKCSEKNLFRKYLEVIKEGGQPTFYAILLYGYSVNVEIKIWSKSQSSVSEDYVCLGRSIANGQKCYNLLALPRSTGPAYQCLMALSSKSLGKRDGEGFRDEKDTKNKGESKKPEENKLEDSKLEESELFETSNPVSKADKFNSVTIHQVPRYDTGLVKMSDPNNHKDFLFNKAKENKLVVDHHDLQEDINELINSAEELEFFTIRKLLFVLNLCSKLQKADLKLIMDCFPPHPEENHLLSGKLSKLINYYFQTVGSHDLLIELNGIKDNIKGIYTAEEKWLKFIFGFISDGFKKLYCDEIFLENNEELSNLFSMWLGYIELLNERKLVIEWVDSFYSLLVHKQTIEKRSISSLHTDRKVEKKEEKEEEKEEKVHGRLPNSFSSILKSKLLIPLIKNTESLNYLTVLDKLLDYNEIITIMRENDGDIDKAIVGSVNKVNHSSASYEYDTMFARIIKHIANGDVERFTYFMSEIDFGLRATSRFPKAIYDSFVPSDSKKMPIGVFSGISMLFDVLVGTRKLCDFSHQDIIRGKVNKTVDILDELFAGRSKLTKPITNLMRTENIPRSDIHLLFSLIFFQLSAYNTDVYHTTQDVWLRIIYYLGKNISNRDQRNFFEKYHNHKEWPEAIKMTLKNLDDLYKFYVHHYYDHHVSRSVEQESKELKGKKLESKELGGKELEGTLTRVVNHLMFKLVTFAKLAVDSSILATVDNLNKVIGHFLEIDFVHLLKVLESKANFGRDERGALINSEAAIITIINELTSNIKPQNWSTHSFQERVFFLYCYAIYPIEEYHAKFREENEKQSDYIRQDLPSTIGGLESLKRSFAGHKSLSDIGFKVLQINQVFSIASAIKPPGDSKYCFQKVGTGQGKSLIIAMTALEYAIKKRELVYVFTVYSHLAKRDFQRFKPLFDKNNIASVLLDRDYEKTIPDNTQIIYGYLDHFLLNVDTNILLKLKNDRRERVNLLRPGVVILDEFDSIVIDSNDYNGYVHDVQPHLNYSQLEREDLEAPSSNSFKRALSNNQPSIERFFSALDEHKIDWPEQWFSRNKNSIDQKGGIRSKASGVRYQTAAGVFRRFLDGEFSTSLVNFSILAFLKNAERVIGFSGSISEADASHRFSDLFPGYTYLTIPPFYKPTTSNSRIQDANETGVPDDSQWLAMIQRSIKVAIDRNQPVLIFGNVEDEKEWNKVKLLCTESARESKRIYNEIKPDDRRSDDSQIVTESKLELASRQNCITLASVIAARGADFCMSRLAAHACGGIHVIITFLPQKNGITDQRVKEQ